MNKWITKAIEEKLEEGGGRSTHCFVSRC